MRRSLILFAAVLLAADSPLARTWHILPDGTGDAPTIQAGIDSASNADTVFVHDGTYTGPGNKNVDFQGKRLVVRSASGPEATVIDCAGSGRGFYVHGASGGTRIDGFTIRNGYTTYGGGIRVSDCSTHIRNCIFEDNTAINPTGGGGIHAAGSWVSIRHCVFSGNSGSGGGAISLNGDGVSADVDSCLISGNVSTHTSLGGGGIGVFDFLDASTVEMVNTTIAGNRAPTYGGGVHSNTGGTTFLISDCIVWGNCAPVGPDAYWSGYPAEIYWSDVDTTKIAGIAALWECISADPLFCGPVGCAEAPTAAGDYTLDAASPCLPQNNPWGQWGMGALGQGCDIYTRVAAGGALSKRGLVISPNPATGRAVLRYALPGNASSTIEVFDLAGRLVRALAAPGAEGSILWDGKDGAGRDVAAGVYFVRAADRDPAETKRVILIR
jgi:hypothetical protein